MDNVSNEVIQLLITDLSKALIYFSNNELSKEKTDFMAKTVIESIDLNDSTFVHKGINWLAKEILKK